MLAPMLSLSLGQASCLLYGFRPRFFWPAFTLAKISAEKLFYLKQELDRLDK
jgi:hypothetical protein